jgi:hypothetical protein
VLTLKRAMIVSWFVVTMSSAMTAEFPSMGCAQGCHRDQYWKVDGECVMAEKITCCVRAWAVAVGGVLTNVGGDVDHWTYGDICLAVCPEKNDSVAIPFQVTEPPVGLFGRWPECYCAGSPSGGGGGLVKP